MQFALLIAGCLCLALAPVDETAPELPPEPEPPPGPTLQDALALKQAQKLPEAEQVLSTLAAAHPDDVAVLIQLATVQGWQSKFAPSIETWRKVVALRPDDPDARVGLARVLYWSEQRPEAIEHLKRALATRPEMPDAHALLGDVYRAGGDIRAARASYERARAAGDSSPELVKKIEQAVPPSIVRVDASFTFDNYGPNFVERTQEWSAFTQVSVDLAPFILSLKFDSLHWFGTVDNLLTAGAVLRLGKAASVGADAGFGTDPRKFGPRWVANVNGELAFTPEVAGLLGYRHMQFDSGPVDMALPAVRIQLGSGFEALLGGAVAHNADDTVTGAFVGRLSYSHQDFLFPYVGLSAGQEDLPPLSAANVLVGSLGVVWNVNAAWSVRADYAHEHRTTLQDAPVYERDSFGAGITLKL